VAEEKQSSKQEFATLFSLGRTPSINASHYLTYRCIKNFAQEVLEILLRPALFRDSFPLRDLSMRHWLSRILFCCLLAVPCFSSPIDQGLINNWNSKKFKGAIRRVRGEGALAQIDGRRENYLHRAVRHDRPQLLMLLLQAPELQDRFIGRNNEGLSAIELSLFLGRTDCFVALLPFLRNPNQRIRNSYGWSLLHLAARFNRAEEIRALVQHGALVDATDLTPDAWTALDVALQAGAIEAASVLRELGGEEPRHMVIEQINAPPAINEVEQQNETDVPTQPPALGVHPQFDQIHYHQAPQDAEEDEDDLHPNRLPLSDFAIGNFALRASAAVLLLLLITNSVGLGGSGLGQ
jgi:ankyrin repeat protein